MLGFLKISSGGISLTTNPVRAFLLAIAVSIIKDRQSCYLLTHCSHNQLTI